MKSSNLLLSTTLLLSALTAQAYTADYPPQDHGGSDLVLQNGDVIWGQHTGIRTLNVLGYVKVKPFNGQLNSGTGRLSVYAETIIVDGGIVGDSSGYSGGGAGGFFNGEVFPPDFQNGGPAAYPIAIWPKECSTFSGHDVGSPDFPSGGYGDGPGGGCPLFLVPESSSIINPTSNDVSGNGMYFPHGWIDQTVGLELEMGSGGGGGSGATGIPILSVHSCVIPGASGGSGGASVALFSQYIDISRGSINCRGGLGRSNNMGARDCHFTTITASGSGSGGSILLSAPQIYFGDRFPLEVSTGEDLFGGKIKIFSEDLIWTNADEIPHETTDSILIAPSNGAFPMATTFFEANHNWEFLSIDGYPASIPTEDSPTGAVIHRANGPESLGIWQSPVYTTGKESSLVRARFTVHSSTPAAQVPTFRMRSLDNKGTETTVLWVDSRADGLYSPTEEGRRYEQYFDLNDGDLRYAFDMVHFQESNAADGEVSLEILEATDVTLPDDVRSDHVYTFESGNDGWSPVTIPEIQGPLFSQDNGSLSMVADTPENVFGFWTSPDDVTIDPNRLYIATFVVESDSDDATTVPTFRCRLNESGYDTASVLHVSSQGPADRSPTVGNPQEYRVYLRPSGVRDDSKLQVSFDLINFIAEDDEKVTLSLLEVRIDSIPVSALPQ